MRRITWCHNQPFTLPHQYNDTLPLVSAAVVSDRPVVFCAVTIPQEVPQDYMNTTTSRSRYHTSMWYIITTSVPVVSDIPVVFCVVTTGTTGNTTGPHEYHSQPFTLPHKSVVHYHKCTCGIKYSCGILCGNNRYRRKFHRTTWIPQPAVHITTQVCGTLPHVCLWYQIFLWYFVW